MLICLTCKASKGCLGPMDFKVDEFYRMPCPRSGCPGEIIEVDDMIAEAVSVLNDKGYTTSDSCSGHFNDGGGRNIFHLAFEQDGLSVPPMDALPVDFVFMDGYAIHNADFVNLDPEGTHDQFKPDTPRTHQLMEMNRKFLDWVLALPARSVS